MTKTLSFQVSDQVITYLKQEGKKLGLKPSKYAQFLILKLTESTRRAVESGK